MPMIDCPKHGRSRHVVEHVTYLCLKCYHEKEKARRAPEAGPAQGGDSAKRVRPS